MPYCNYSPDVEKRIRAFFEPRDAPVGEGPPATKPTLTEVSAIIDDVAARIDMRLRARGVALPLGDPEALAHLAPINAAGAAAATLRAAVTREQGEGSAAQALETEFADGLAFIDGGGLDRDTPRSSAGFAHGMAEIWPPEEAPY